MTMQNANIHKICAKVFLSGLAIILSLFAFGQGDTSSLSNSETNTSDTPQVESITLEPTNDTSAIVLNNADNINEHCPHISIELNYLIQIALTPEAILRIDTGNVSSCSTDSTIYAQQQMYHLQGSQVPFYINLVCAPRNLVLFELLESNGNVLVFSGQETCDALAADYNRNIIPTQPFLLNPEAP